MDSTKLGYTSSDVKELLTLVREYVDGPSCHRAQVEQRLRPVLATLECKVDAALALETSVAEKRDAFPVGDEWRRLAQQNKPIDAIRSLRSLHGYGLFESKQYVEAYIRVFRDGGVG